MTLVINNAATEVLPGERRAPNVRTLEPPLAPMAMPRSRLRKLIGGPVTLPEIFPVAGMIVIVGYLLWCIMGEPAPPWML